MNPVLLLVIFIAVVVVGGMINNKIRWLEYRAGDRYWSKTTGRMEKKRPGWEDDCDWDDCECDAEDSLIADEHDEDCPARQRLEQEALIT